MSAPTAIGNRLTTLLQAISAVLLDLANTEDRTVLQHTEDAFLQSWQDFQDQAAGDYNQELFGRMEDAFVGFAHAFHQWNPDPMGNKGKGALLRRARYMVRKLAKDYLFSRKNGYWLGYCYKALWNLEGSPDVRDPVFRGLCNERKRLQEFDEAWGKLDAVCRAAIDFILSIDLLKREAGLIDL